jgi:hypothetical protein
MPILHNFLVTSAGYTSNRDPMLSAGFYYSNYQKDVTAYGKTNTVYINVKSSTSAYFPGYSFSYSNYDNYATGIQYCLSTGFASSAMFDNQPGILRENNGSKTPAVLTQYLRPTDVKTYIITSDGNSVFINIDRGQSRTKFLEDNASIYWCGVVDPTGAGSYSGGTLITGVGVNNIHYSNAAGGWTSNTEKNNSNILFATSTQVANTIVTFNSSATSGNMYAGKTYQWYNGPDDTYYKKLITNTGYSSTYYDDSTQTPDSNYIVNKIYTFKSDQTNSKYEIDYKTGNFDSVTGRMLPVDVQLFVHRGSEKYSFIGSPPNIKMLPTPMKIKTLDLYSTFSYNGENYLIVSY